METTAQKQWTTSIMVQDGKLPWAGHLYPAWNNLKYCSCAR